MRINELIARQWNDYETFHQSPKNLVIHLIAVPLFWFGLIGAASALYASSLFAALVCAKLAVTSLGLQAYGHRHEPVPATPFAGPADAIARLLTEQLITFPRYLLSGRLKFVRACPSPHDRVPRAS